MKVVNDQAWAKTVSEMKANEEGRQFHEFVTLWADASEEYMSRTGATAVDALRATLTSIEEHLKQLVVADWIGQMLTVLSMHWVHKDTMQKDMTTLEFRMIESAIGMKLMELQQEAASHAGQSATLQ
ncbi:hypothetical protein SEA_PUPPER_139 [Gordonia phage Pupper]|uniref:Uncharacterized protein n=1 Tax=Gordonia phage Pupper TaxID=2571249 RepID=A0A4Y6EKQ6_9CAUD|nr:hypothetical protein KHQ83_gp138 [Gordonia phage Pupper]QDF18625.1 hypothetical protein SEA_PUPPER_139 [Gordonia phage Pupper]